MLMDNTQLVYNILYVINSFNKSYLLELKIEVNTNAIDLKHVS